MEEQIRFLAFNGCKVLLVDLSNCNPEQVSRLCRLVPSQISGEPPGSVLLLADFTGAKFDKDAFTSLKEAAVFVRPRLKRSAWVGTENFPKVYYESIKAFSQRNLPIFKSREEALAWLSCSAAA